MMPVMTYTDVLQRLRAHDLLVDRAEQPNRTLSGRVQEDSRLVGPGDIFVAVSGTHQNGLDFVAAALEQGAALVVAASHEGHGLGLGLGEDGQRRGQAPRSQAPDVPWIRVTDARCALVELVSLSFRDPGHRLGLAAVTGTNGKTTTATLIAGALNALGHTAGFVGTTGYRYAGQDIPATHTTPSCVRLHALLFDMLEQGCTHAAIEASSHALDQHRLRPADVDVAVFTNLTRDHLDYHGSEQAYLSAKKRLFDGLSSTAWAIVNGDDPAACQMTADCRARVVRVGEVLPGRQGHPLQTGADVDLAWHITASHLDGLELVLDGQACCTRLPGRFNAINAALTYGVLTAFGASRRDALGVLETAEPAPGRFETLRLGGERTAVIDYAHTPDALAQILDAVRGVMDAETPKGASRPRLWVVFGCGGDRDRGKRPLMGRVAEERADRVVVTSDNPRFEDPEAIIDDVLAGMHHPGAVLREADRARAVQAAVRGMNAGDILVVAGKGHETVQVVGSEAIPCDDRHILEGA